MSKLTLASKPVQLALSENEIFDQGVGYKMWKKGQVTRPSWLDRQNGSDFITIKTERNLADLDKYLSAVDDRLAVQFNNVFSTGHDKNENRMVFLYDQDETGDNKKIAIICILARDLALRVVELAEQYCGDSS